MSLADRLQEFLNEYDAIGEFQSYEQESSFLRDAI